jgi:hypothetical protein
MYQSTGEVVYRPVASNRDLASQTGITELTHQGQQTKIQK